jgi:16S rRNA (guanine527-N7)-methyltransferase
VSDPRLEHWLDLLLSTPGLTSIRDRDEARRVHVDGSLAGADQVARFAGAIVDVGSGGGSPGVPLAIAFPDRTVTLLEANGRKAAFLERIAAEFANIAVVRGRAEEQPVDEFGVAVARALASPPVAAEWCLPLVAPSGGVVLYVGPTADPDAVARVAARIGGGEPEQHPGLIVIPKETPTPPGFPRRPGMARKRPLA